ncbi:hypothetical protein ANO14919_044250 [Xylariales sp. No.14919]|nr:hypothetical protein ANO14919_044250 [Xylariales sp. No.14919]
MAPTLKYTAWSEKVHEDIMLAMFDMIQSNGILFSGVVDNLHNKGYKFTANALKNNPPIFVFTHTDNLHILLQA